MQAVRSRGKECQGSAGPGSPSSHQAQKIRSVTGESHKGELHTSERGQSTKPSLASKRHQETNCNVIHLYRRHSQRTNGPDFH